MQYASVLIVFAFEKNCNLETRVRGSFKVTGNGTVRQVVHDFLLMFSSNYGSILHRF